jgi:two-component sensor histidine kinase
MLFFSFRAWILLGGGWVWLVSCRSDDRAGGEPSRWRSDSLAFYAYIDAGDSVYAQKNGYASFAQSLAYYDSAGALADRSGDSLLRAEAIFAKGRVYDAWNKQPRQTIAHFARAAQWFRAIPGQYTRYIYAQHLLAHAYDKRKDSLRAVRVLNGLYQELNPRDTALLRQIPCTAEMALIATEVRAYPLAARILERLTRRAWMRNDPDTYDYLNHYYLTQSRLDVYWRKPRHSDYLDSLRSVYEASTNLMDRLYYGQALAELHAARGDYATAGRYYAQVSPLQARLDNDRDVESMHQAVLQSEVLVERNKLAYRQSLNRLYRTATWVLSGLLALITLLSTGLYWRNRTFRRQARQLAAVNRQLDEKVGQVELLNKEIQHRVQNNLHMVYGLLQMQERRTDAPQAVAALQSARRRIERIVEMHQQLLINQEPPDLTAYFHDLIQSVGSGLPDERPLQAHLRIEVPALPAPLRLPVSLIINEWVTNSVKYARPAGPALEISLCIRQEAGTVWVDYADNGPVPAGPVPAPGMGLQIVRLLSRQVNATLTTPPASPYRYQLSVPVEA